MRLSGIDGLIIVLLAVGVAVLASDVKIVAQPAVPSCVTDEERVVIRAMTLEAVNQAMTDHMKVLFAGWLKDPRDQPNRASAGLQAAIAAYQKARHDALHWTPKEC